VLLSSRREAESKIVLGDKTAQGHLLMKLLL
jgi:hypothetical protein